MALFGSREELYEYELCMFGVTYCNDMEDADVLMIAPGLVNHPFDLDVVEARESSVEMLDYLYVDDKLVGFAYAPIAPMLSHYMNGIVPKTFRVSDVTELFKLGIFDPQSHRCISEEECKQVAKVYEDADALISKMPDLPDFILERIKEHIADNYPTHSIH